MVLDETFKTNYAFTDSDVRSNDVGKEEINIFLYGLLRGSWKMQSAHRGYMCARY